MSEPWGGDVRLHLEGGTDARAFVERELAEYLPLAIRDAAASADGGG